MLGKLLKYEFKATARIFLLMYAALLALAALNAVILPLNGNASSGLLGSLPFLYSILSSLSVLLYVLVAAGTMVVTLVIIIVRFYRMLGNEGYLWFTLPASANQHILGKLIVALVWTTASIVVMTLSIGLLALPTGWVSELWRIPELWNEAVLYGYNPGLWLTCLAVTGLVSVIYSILTFYTAMSIGPNLIKSRLGGSVLTFIIITVIVQILGSITLMTVIGPLIMQGETIIQATAEGYVMSGVSGIMPDIGNVTAAVNQIVVTLTMSFCIFSAVLAVVFYLVTRYFISHKLNLA